MLIDTHAHLNAPEFADTVPDVLDRAEAAGVGHVVCVGYDIATSERALALAAHDVRVSATVGVHPNSVAQAPHDWRERLRELAHNPNVVAIGETGLDYYRAYTPHSDQIEALRWHLALADDVGLPVILHNRDADVDVSDELLLWTGQRASTIPPGILHSFCGSASMMQRCVAAGFAISFSGMVTFPNRSLAHLDTLARDVPAVSLLVETDSPYLTPVPHRGQRNEPAFVRAIAERLAALRSCRVDEIERDTSHNAGRVLHRLGDTGRA